MQAGRDAASLGVVIACALLQVATIALARWAYLGFGWRMYSKIAGDMRLPDIERRRRVGLRFDRFTALAKLDAQLLSLLFIVGIVNGINPSAQEFPALIAVTSVGVAASAGWLAACWIAVTRVKPNLGLASEFTYPLCYIVAAAFMFASVYYGSSLVQIHGQIFLIVYPILFVVGRTCVWWDARLLSGSDEARLQRDVVVKEGKGQRNNRNIKDGRDNAVTGGTGAPSLQQGSGQYQQQVPPEILPLVHGAWLLKLPSIAGPGGSPSKRSLAEAMAGGSGGRWRYFQLSHDGSTLRWDWRKYVLLMHVESVSACTQDLTITLSLTLEPDLRLKFPDTDLHAVWARGLTLLVMLLGNPDGLEGRASRRISIGNRDLIPASSGIDPGSPNRLLHRLASASARASAAGLLSKEALQAAAVQARRALGDHSQPPSPNCPCAQGEDLEKGVIGDRTMGTPRVIELHATAFQHRPGSANNSLRQRTPSRRSMSGQKSENTTLPGEFSPPNSRESVQSGTKRRKSQHATNNIDIIVHGKTATHQQSWLRRTLTAPVSTLATNLQKATAPANNATNNTSRQLHFDDLEAQVDSPPPMPPFHRHGTQQAQAWPHPPIQQQQMAAPFASSMHHRPGRHARSSSLGNEAMMPPVPEGVNTFTPSAVGGNFSSPGQPGSGGTGGSLHYVPSRLAKEKSASPASGGKGSSIHGGSIAKQNRTRGGSPLKPAIASLTGQPLLRFGSAPMHALHRTLSEMDGTSDSDGAASIGGVSSSLHHPLAQQLAVGASGDMSRQASTVAANLVRYDSLGGQWAAVPGSKVWQAMFDAGMAAGAYGHVGSTDGSLSQSATPHSVARSVAVNVELIDFAQLKFGRMLGEGVDGPVYAAWFQETPVAVKRASCPSEVELHLHAGWHDNVVNLRGLAQHGGHTYLVMELCPRGTLDMLIHQGSASSKLDPTKLLPIVRSIARGMLHLHTRSPPVMHRDLKPANIFIGHGFVMKIGDFGMARYAADTRLARAAQAHISPSKFGNGSALLRTLTPGVIGTASYCAPELLQPQTPKAGEAEAFDPDALLKADVYSFGCLLWELLERKRPYADMDGFQVQTQWLLDSEAMKLKPPKVSDTLPGPARKIALTLSSLVESCTAWDPDQRPNFKEILSLLRNADGSAPPTPITQLASPFCG